MLDEREGPVEAAEAHRAFNRQSVWRRFGIVVAGPLANFLFAIAAYAGLFMYGLPEARPVLGAPPAGSVAAAAGLRAGDTVRAVDGRAITTWQELRWRVLQSALQRVRCAWKSSTKRTICATYCSTCARFRRTMWRPTRSSASGCGCTVRHSIPVIGQVVRGGAAERAGLAFGDRVVLADGKPVDSWEALVAAVQAKPELPLTLTIERDGARRTIEVVPASVAAGERRIGRIGAAPQVPAVARRPDADPRAARGRRELVEGAAEDRRHRRVQPEDARQDVARRGVVEAPFRPGHDRRLRWPVGRRWVGSRTSPSSR